MGDTEFYAATPQNAKQYYFPLISFMFCRHVKFVCAGALRMLAAILEAMLYGISGYAKRPKSFHLLDVSLVNPSPAFVAHGTRLVYAVNPK